MACVSRSVVEIADRRITPRCRGGRCFACAKCRSGASFGSILPLEVVGALLRSSAAGGSFRCLRQPARAKWGGHGSFGQRLPDALLLAYPLSPAKQALTIALRPAPPGNALTGAVQTTLPAARGTQLPRVSSRPGVDDPMRELSCS